MKMKEVISAIAFLVVGIGLGLLCLKAIGIW